MKRRTVLVPLLASALVATGIGAITMAQAAGAGTTRQIPAGGTVTLSGLASQAGSDAIQDPEFRFETETDAQAKPAGPTVDALNVVNRSLSDAHPRGPAASSAVKAKSNPEQVLAFRGLNHRQQRLANGGNQFSVEPPDQGLCVGNGFVLETVNDVMRVFDTTGDGLTAPTDLNSFYGYIAAINRTTGVQGPFVTDPSCLFDRNTQRWYHVVLTLDVYNGGPNNGRFTGTNHLDLAVSNTSDPRGTWTIYRLPAQDDGTDGTPDHNCSPGNGSEFATNPTACFGDYPHIGADRNGFYITTNEYDLFGPNFKGAEIYAFDKWALASGAASVAVTEFDTAGPSLGGQPGFTVWPAVTPAQQFSDALGGTEYFLSSRAAEEATGVPGGGSASTIGLWALSNTSSLASASPSLTLQNLVLDSETYAIPPKADQKGGDFPLGQCINDTTTTITSLGPPFVGCWQALFAAEPQHTEILSHLDSNDSRMQQVFYANGKVWGALDTAVTVGGANKAGIAYFVVKPDLSTGTLAGSMAKQGYLALAGNNLTYPSIAVLPNGRGVMSFTVVGADNFPSVGYASMDALVGAGDVHVAIAGEGTADGFTSYKSFVGNPPRTRWGDYGAAVVDGRSIWVAQEYINQGCTFAQYIAAPFGACESAATARRSALGNWATGIVQLIP